MYTETTELEIPTSELRIGMHVIRLDRPWEETDFLLQGFVVRDRDEIQALQAQCHTVIIEGKVRNGPRPAPPGRQEKQPSMLGRLLGKKPEPRRRNVSARPAANAATGNRQRSRVTYINKVDVGSEFSRARRAYTQAKTLAEDIMAGVRIGRALDINRARAVVDDCVDSLLRNENALLLLTKLKHKDHYTAEHSINVSVLAAALGKHLGMLEEEIRTLGLCGLLHDVGKMRIPNTVLNKPGTLTPDEHALMRSHAGLGRDILINVNGVNHAAIDVAYNHHERLDGKGYPRGLRGSQIPHFAKVVAVVDTYDAITSTRCYDGARSSLEALEILYRMRDRQFDPELTLEFIRMIGIFPPGSLVELASGEVGIVLASNPRNRRKPVIKLVRDAGKQPLAEEITLDLSSETSLPPGLDGRIAREIPDGTYDIRLQSFLDQGLILRPEQVRMAE